MKLVVNGDDFGYTKGVCDGIIEGYHSGVLRSTTAFANSKYLAYAKELSDQNPGLGVGLHLNCTVGKSLTENKTLTDENGEFFPGRKTIWEKNVDYDELYAEWKAQIERFKEVFHRLPTHLDSHHSVHDANEKALAVSKRLAEEYGLEMRRYGRFAFVINWFGENATAENLLEVLEKNKGKDLEIMAHPAFCDLELYRVSSYSLARVKELDALCDKRVLEYVEKNGIELCHY